MTNPSKQTGTKWESAVVQYLRDNGFPYAERRALNGGKDLGDITGIPGVVIECKAARAIDLAGWIAELRAEMVNAGVDTGWLVIKRRGKASPADAYWVTVGPQAVQTIKDGWGNTLHTPGKDT